MEKTENIRLSKINAVRQTDFRLCVLLAIFAASSLTSCVKDDLFNTPNPDKGAVMFSADFSERSASCAAPVEYLLHHTCCGATEPCTMPGEGGKCPPELLAPGRHTFHAWNGCGRMTVTDGVAKVDETARGVIESLPGYFFTAQQEIEVVQDDTLRVDIPMAQRTRDLHFELTLTEGDPELIKSVTGTLTGIAGAFDLATQKTAGEAVATTVAFTRTGDKLTTDARLLGVIGAAQTLKLEIGFTDRADIHRVSVDLSEAMKGFNDDMTTTRKITGSVETPVGADEVTATITGWQDVYGDPTEAE